MITIVISLFLILVLAIGVLTVAHIARQLRTPSNGAHLMSSEPDDEPTTEPDTEADSEPEVELDTGDTADDARPVDAGEDSEDDTREDDDPARQPERPFAGLSQILTKAITNGVANIRDRMRPR